MRHAVIALGSCLLLAACSAGGRPSGDRARVAIDVAPLALDGVTDAEYAVTVTNGAGGAGALVWSRTLRASAYGDGRGALAYVGPCDATTGGTNSVTVELLRLWDGADEVPPTSYKNPGPLTKDAACAPNTDSAVTFDVTLARAASQGFFDVAIAFEDVFCSAKLDCERDGGADLDLLFRPDGPRDMTAVLGFACASRSGGPLYLYMDDVVIDCAGYDLDARVDPSGLGNVALDAGRNANADHYLFGASVFRGRNDETGVAFWNVSFGLDEARFGAAQSCRLTTRATASSDAFPQEPDGFPLPAGTVWPVVTWDVELSDAGGRRCHEQQVDVDGSGVATTYLGYRAAPNALVWQSEPIHLRHRYEGETGLVLSATGAVCNPGCAHGSCVAADTCACEGTGFEGPTCATPVCPGGCEHGACTAPGVCTCDAGYEGGACAVDTNDCAPSPCLNGGACEDRVAGYVCACVPGFWGGDCEAACDPGSCAGTMACDQDTGEATACDACEAGAWGATCAGACDAGQCVGTMT
ncbi:MAG: calcium-binding EGF-like domain-containing protein, partial [Myxococcales bacterium]|nr:calcium-binding EGF-like domain-containing protein [Myxococcales bacterium]